MLLYLYCILYINYSSFILQFHSQCLLLLLAQQLYANAAVLLVWLHSRQSRSGGVMDRIIGQRVVWIQHSKRSRKRCLVMIIPLWLAHVRCGSVHNVNKLVSHHDSFFPVQSVVVIVIMLVGIDKPIVPNADTQPRMLMARCTHSPLVQIINSHTQMPQTYSRADTIDVDCCCCLYCTSISTYKISFTTLSTSTHSATCAKWIVREKYETAIYAFSTCAKGDCANGGDDDVVWCFLMGIAIHNSNHSIYFYSLSLYLQCLLLMNITGFVWPIY